MSRRAVCVLGSLALTTSLSGLSGCVNPQITGNDMYVATTARTYSEARAFYLSDPLKLAPRGVHPDVRQLLAPFQANELIETKLDLEPARAAAERAGSHDSTAAAGGPNTAGGTHAACCQTPPRETRYQPPEPTLELPSIVRANDPLTVIVNKVVTPGGSGTRDLAVVLDVATAQPNEAVAPLVVWYQRDVPAGKELAFDNLLVAVEEHWDATFPPYFRLRLIDVRKEDNKATLELLGGVEKLANSLSSVIPSPWMPGVALGIEAGKQILGHQCNVVLMDYTVQFYSGATKSSNGGADLGYLATGHWIAIGINRAQESEFWRQNLYYDQRTMRVYSAEDLSRLLRIEHEKAARYYGPQDSVVPTALEGLDTFRPRIDAPIVLMTVSTAQTAVPKIAHKRSQELLALLQSDGASMDFDKLSTNLQSLTSSLSVFSARRRLERQQTYEGMSAVMDILSRHETASSATATESDRRFKLNDTDVTTLMLLLEQQTEITNIHSVKDWLIWWRGDPQNPSSTAKLGKTGNFVKVANSERLVWKIP